MRGLDVSPLTRPVAEQELSRFIAHSRAAWLPWSRMTTGVAVPDIRHTSDLSQQLLPYIIGLGVLAFLSYGTLGWTLDFFWAFMSGPFPLNVLFTAIVVAALAAVVWAILRVVGLIRGTGSSRQWWLAAYRLTHFAATNSLRYGHDETVSYPGLIFGTGSDRVVERRLTSTRGRRVEIGNYRYLVRYGDDTTARVVGWGYVAITLDRRMPHLLVDATINNSSVFGLNASNLPADLDPNQRLTLGGEFDDRFTLYAPQGYGRDAFQLFAPDLMALFLDRLGTFDVEIVDDTMFVYGARFDLVNPATYAWLEELVDTVVARTVRRTSSYRDDLALREPDQVPPVFELVPGFFPGVEPQATVTAPITMNPMTMNPVAEKGRRLRPRSWALWAVLGVVIIGLWLYVRLMPILEWLGW